MSLRLQCRLNDLAASAIAAMSASGASAAPELTSGDRSAADVSGSRSWTRGAFAKSWGFPYGISWIFFFGFFGEHLESRNG